MGLGAAGPDQGRWRGGNFERDAKPEVEIRVSILQRLFKRALAPNNLALGDSPLAIDPLPRVTGFEGRFLSTSHTIHLCANYV